MNGEEKLAFGWLILFTQSKLGVDCCKSLALAELMVHRDRVMENSGKEVKELAKQVSLDVSNLFPRNVSFKPSEFLRRSALLDLDAAKIYPRNESWIASIVDCLIHVDCRVCSLNERCDECKKRRFQIDLFGNYWACRYRENPFIPHDQIGWSEKALNSVTQQLIESKLEDPTVESVNKEQARKAVEDAVNSVTKNLVSLLHKEHESKPDKYLALIVSNA